MANITLSDSNGANVVATFTRTLEEMRIEGQRRANERGSWIRLECDGKTETFYPERRSDD